MIDDGGFAGAAGAALSGGTPDTTGIAAGAPADIPNIVEKPKKKRGSVMERRYGKSMKAVRRG